MRQLAAYPTVSIVILTYQGGAYLPATLTAIRAQDYPNTVEIIAVDSESTDNTRAIVGTYSAALIPITQRQFTYGYARNLGVQHAVGEVIVFISQDARPMGTDWLQTLVTPLADPMVGGTYARQIARSNATPLETFFQLTLYPPKSKRYHLSPDQQRVVLLADSFFSNVCSAARRDICLKFPFDSHIIMSEDQVFARALLQAGYATYYNAVAMVIHSHRYDLKTLFRRNFDSAYSLIGVSSDTFWTTARQGIAYIAHEAIYIVQQRRWRWLLAIPPYEIARIAGRLLGTHANRLPKRWRQRFSLHREYWSRLSE